MEYIDEIFIILFKLIILKCSKKMFNNYYLKGGLAIYPTY